MLLFSVLLGQTVYILNGSERRYINLRHLLIKWTTLVVITMFAGYAKRHTNFDEMFEFMCNMLALAMVYPSKVRFFITIVYQESASQIFRVQLTQKKRIKQRRGQLAGNDIHNAHPFFIHHLLSEHLQVHNHLHRAAASQEDRGSHARS